MKALSAGGIAAVAVLLSGCETAPQFYQLEREVQEIKAAQRGGGSSVPDERVAELGAQLDALHDEVARLRGRVEETQHLAEQAMEEAKAASEKSSQSAPPAGAVVPVDGGGVSDEARAYDEAFSVYRAGEYEAAIDRFRAFLQNHASSDHADNALFWMGECYFKLGDYERAVLTFEDVVSRYPEGNKVPDALYRQGIALLEIGKKSDEPESYQLAASQIFEKITTEHPDSERVSEAKKQLERIQ